MGYTDLKIIQAGEKPDCRQAGFVLPLRLIFLPQRALRNYARLNAWSGRQRPQRGFQSSSEPSEGWKPLSIFTYQTRTDLCLIKFILPISFLSLKKFSSFLFIE
ncbi:MAG: hypothetical protein BGP14_13645 [Sphingobacteriales bacterium 44-15]|nr:MAG: hypothetical protein BGP14_13645 [Sphingobacteriales bacterium 44-15]